MAFSPNQAIKDAEYLLQRAAAEGISAEHARCDAAAAVHHQLASRYLDRVFGDFTRRPADCQGEKPVCRRELLSYLKGIREQAPPRSLPGDMIALLRQV